MSWRYRVLKSEISPGEFEYGIHEVYRNEMEEIIGFSEDSMVPVCPSVEGLIYELDLLKKACFEPVIDMKTKKEDPS